MGPSVRFTVFTTSNRAHTLPRVYESLRRAILNYLRFGLHAGVGLALARSSGAWMTALLLLPAAAAVRWRDARQLRHRADRTAALDPTTSLVPPGRAL